jgi:dienelactone hydrolase
MPRLERWDSALADTWRCARRWIRDAARPYAPIPPVCTTGIWGRIATRARLSQIKAELLLVFGDVDPHVPAPARAAIRAALQTSGVKHTYLELPGEHAFMRDEGARYDPAMADRVFADAIALFRRVFG